MEIVKDIAAIVGCIVSIITLLTLTTKGGRNFVIRLFKKHTRDLVETNERQNKSIEKQNQSIDEIKNTLNTILGKLDIEDEIAKQNCRNTIKDIYYKYQAVKKIPLYERKTADKTYDLYTNQLEGNSYATLLYNEIVKWEITTISDKDLLED